MYYESETINLIADEIYMNLLSKVSKIYMTKKVKIKKLKQ